jgi:hypothetical protein
LKQRKLNVSWRRNGDNLFLKCDKASEEIRANWDWVKWKYSEPIWISYGLSVVSCFKAWIWEFKLKVNWDFK